MNADLNTLSMSCPSSSPLQETEKGRKKDDRVVGDWLKNRSPQGGNEAEEDRADSKKG